MMKVFCSRHATVSTFSVPKFEYYIRKLVDGSCFPFNFFVVFFFLTHDGWLGFLSIRMHFDGIIIFQERGGKIV